MDNFKKKIEKKYGQIEKKEKNTKDLLKRQGKKNLEKFTNFTNERKTTKQNCRTANCDTKLQFSHF